jgi:fatty-acyl-CoA synthase
MQPNSFPELLERLAGSDGDAHRYRDGNSTTELTHGELIAEADGISRGMQQLGIKPSDRVGLVLYQPRDFVPAFLGCIRGGFIPVPLYPPTTVGRLDAWVRTTGKMLAAAEASLLLADAQVAIALSCLRDEVPTLREVVSVSELPDGGELRGTPVVDGDVCFLQFTSGSTTAPRGVRVTHGSLWANACAIIVDGLSMTPEDRGVSWLPLYHDMGLIGFVMAPLVTRTPITFLTTLDFLKRPDSWVRALSEERGTISFAPNFGYALTTRRTKSVDGLDLSAVRVMGCGAEPIQPDIIDRFFDRFRDAGLRRSAFLSCYGLAESTLAVTFAAMDDELEVDRVDLNSESRTSDASPASDGQGLISVVSCGRPLPGHRVSILGPSEDTLSDRRIGEIFVEGPSVADGYWNDEEGSGRVFVGGGVKTGDLGYLSSGKLHVVGRIKDTIIIGGRNYDPASIEMAASNVDGVRTGSVAAFSLPGDLTDRIVIAAEHRDGDSSELKKNIVRAVQRDLGLTVSDVAILEVGSLPKTTSGKLQRSAAKEQYLEGTLGLTRRHTSLQTSGT